MESIFTRYAFKECFNPSKRHNLHFHDNFIDHDCPRKKCVYEVVDIPLTISMLRIVYCKNCGWAMKRDLKVLK